MGNTKSTTRAGPQNPDKINEETIDALGRHLGRLKELDAGAAAAAVRYVVDGADEGVLLTLGGLQGAPKALGLVHDYQDKENHFERGTKERAELLRAGKGCPPGVWVRLGQVLEAAGRTMAQKPAVPPGWPAWLHSLVVAVVAAWHMAHRGNKQPRPWSLNDLQAVLAAGEQPFDLIARTFAIRPIRPVRLPPSPPGLQYVADRAWSRAAGGLAGRLRCCEYRPYANSNSNPCLARRWHGSC
jgi:hypothetical protein